MAGLAAQMQMRWGTDLANSVHGGGSGIRTHGSLRIAGFQDRCFKPLSHPSSFGLQTSINGFTPTLKEASDRLPLPVVTTF
jgi:hypothetical protein